MWVQVSVGEDSVKPFSAGGRRCTLSNRDWHVYTIFGSHDFSVATAIVRVMGRVRGTLEHPCSGEAIAVPILPKRYQDANSR